MDSPTTTPQTLRELLSAMKEGYKLFSPILVRVQEGVMPAGELTMEQTMSKEIDVDWGQQYAQEYAGQEIAFIGENSLEGSKRQAVALGRSRSCEIRIDSTSVSKHHASIAFDRERGSYSVTDNNSRNGTCINGELTVAGIATPLWAGAYISFGEAVYVFFDTPTLRHLAKSYAAS